MKNNLLFLFFITIGFYGLGQNQSLEFASGDGNPTATNGPAQTTSIRFRYNNDNPNGNTFQTYTPAVTASYQLTNQQFTFAPISTNRPVNFGYTTSGGTAILQNIDTYGTPSAAWYTSNGASAGTGINTTSNFGVVINSNTTPLRISGAATSVTQHWMSDVVVTFSQAVTNPILHLGGMGGTVGTFGFSQEYDVISSNTSFTLTRLSGSNAFGVTGTKINNTATTMAATGTNNSGSGSVMINGTGITTLTIRIYVRGDGSSAASTSWATSNTAIDSGDTTTLGFSLLSTSSSCITTTPSSSAQNLCVNGPATPISVTATGATSYQWYYSDAANGGTITTVAGATSASYTPPTTAAFATRYYFVTVETSCGTYSSYPRSPVTVNANPTFTSNQTTGTQTVCQSVKPAILAVSATGITYQWYTNTTNNNSGGTPIAGATSATYDPPASSTPGTTYYYAVITSTTSGCSTASNVRGITIVPFPTITTPPDTTPQNLCVNSASPTLSVTATNATAYQWFYSDAATAGNITTITGATSSSYTIPTTAAFATRYYYVRISNGSCNTTSSPRTPITVSANPTFITNLTTTTQTACQNAATTALTVTATGVSYQWYSNSTNSSTGGTLISGATTNSYTPSTAIAGTQYYYVVITNTTTGCATASNVKPVTINGITSQPVTTQTICQNAPATTLSITTSPTATAYQWYYNSTNSTTGGTAIPGATTSTYTPPTNNLGTFYFYVTATVGGCVVTSTTSQLIVNCTWDSDNDGVPNSTDLDDDNDGILDLIECPGLTERVSNGNFDVNTTGWTLGAGWVYNTADGLRTIENQTDGSVGTATQTLSGLVSGNSYRLSFSIGAQDFSNAAGNISSLTVRLGGVIYGTFSNSVLRNTSNVTLAVSNGATSNFIPFGTGSQTGYTFTNLSIIIPYTGTDQTLSFQMNGGTDDWKLDNISLITSNSCDTDGDGIPDYLDLDSDNDGCLDALEGDENVTPVQLVAAASSLSVGTGSSASNQNLCATPGCVNASGVPTIVNSGGAADIGGDQGQGAGFAQTAAINTCKDTDGDGVPDYLDLDNDNDGILDASEMSCVPLNAIQPTTAGSVNTYSGTGTPTLNATFRISTVQTAAYTYIANIFGYTNITAIAAQTNTGNPVNSITFSRPVYSLDTALDDVDNSETATLRFYDEFNNLIPGSVVQQFVVFTGSQISSVTYPSGQSILVTAGAASSTTTDSAVRMTFPRSLGISRIEYQQVTTGGGGSNNGLVLMNGCVDIDTDNDGTWNRYDLDSDNDGCLDAIEGDENVTSAQLVTAASGLTSGTGSPALNQNLCSSGGCVNANGVPNIVNSGGAADIGGDEGQGIGDSQNVSLGCSPITCSVNMYLSQNANTQLFLFDKSTNPISYPPIGTASGIQYNAIAISPINGEMYGMKNASRTLIGINSNGTFVELGDVTGMPAVTTFSYNTGEIDDLGNYYVTPAGSGITTMYKINVTTRTATTITLSQGLQISDLAYNVNDGKLYSVNIDGRFLSINTTTGQVTFIGTTTGPMTFGAMFGSPSGIFGADNNGGLYQIDVATGVKIKISDSPSSGTNDGAHCVTMPITFDADLYVTKTDNTQFYTPGSTTTYTVVVGNNGIFGAQNAHVTDAVPTGIPNANMTYTAVVSSGSTTTVTGTMTGAINDYVSLPVGGTVTYTVTITIPLTFTGSLTNTATITPSAATSDTNLTNNTATDTDAKIITACDPVVWYQTDDDKLYAADVNTGVSTLVCNSFYTVGEGVFDIGFNTSGIMYTTNYNFSDGKSYFYRFNTSTCTFTKLTNTGGIELTPGSNSLSFLPDGTALLGNSSDALIQRVTISGNNYTVNNWYTITDTNASVAGGDFILFEGKVYAAMLNSSLQNYIYELSLDSSYNVIGVQNIYPDTSGLSQMMFGMAQSGGDLYGGFTDNTVRRLIFSPGSMTFSANVLNAPASGQIYGMTSLQEAFGVQTPTITSNPSATNGTLAVCTTTPVSVLLTSSLSTGLQWYKDNIIIPGATSQTYTATALGSYTVAYTNTNGCVYIADPIVITGGGSCACYKPGATTGGSILDTKVGITSLARAGSEDADNWPMTRKGGWIALESKTKGFIVNRVAFSDADSNPATPDVPTGIPSGDFIEGMMVYDITNKCLKMYTSTNGGTTYAWYCISTQTCPD